MSRKIVLTNGMTTLVDDEDYERLSSFVWFFYENTAGNQYAVRCALKCESAKWKKSKRLFMHREVLNFPTSEIDHRDGNGLNNQKANLRFCTRSQNNMNRRLNTNSKSGYKGVFWDTWANRWRANIKKDGKNIYIGVFVNLVDAAKAYDEVAKILFGEFARLNFPDMPGKFISE